jgi:hypothetical protein
MNLFVAPSFINSTNYSGFKLKTLADLVNFIIPLLTVIAALLFGGMLLFAAFNFLTAGSDAEKIDKARNTMTFAVVGLLVILAAFTIVKLLEFVLNIDLPL